MQDIDKEKLRAFEQKMHDEGADGFADGPRPWETWDESGAQAGSGKHVWEGKARRIYKNTPTRRSIGDRILSGLATIALATMVVGIAGVYLTEEQPQTVAWTAIQPTPIPLPEQSGTAAGQRLPARVLRPAPVLAEIESLPPPAAGKPVQESGKATAEMPTLAMPPLAETDSDRASDTTASVDTSAATATGDGPALETAADNTDIEIVTSPAALLLTSTTGTSPDDSNEVPDMEMDPALAMEIATAPAVDSDIDAVPAAAGMTIEEAGAGTTPASTLADSSMDAAMLPATDYINRGTTGASHATADSTLPETASTTAGFADAADMDTAPQSTVDDTEPARVAATLTDTTAAPAAGSQAMTATDDVAVLENLEPAAAGPATTAADDAGLDDMSGEATAPVAGIPAGSNMPARDMPPASAQDSPAIGNSVVALAEPGPATAAPAPAAAVPAGNWVVNLATYTHESMARKKLAEFRAKGVTGEIESAVINDKTMYRIRVTGFASSRSARASISSLEATLGLKGAWIARR